MMPPPIYELPLPKTPTTPQSHRLSLAGFTPFLDPFGTPPAFSTPQTCSTLSDTPESLSCAPVRSVEVAYVATRTAADLIRVVDLHLVSMDEKTNTIAARSKTVTGQSAGTGIRNVDVATSPDVSLSSLHCLHSSPALSLRRSVLRTDPSPTPASLLSLSPSPVIAGHLPSTLEPATLDSHLLQSNMASSSNHPPAPRPPTDQDESYLRWSKTASTIFSDQSNFFFNGKRSTGQFSDFSGSFPTPASLAAAAASQPAGTASGLELPSQPGMLRSHSQPEPGLPTLTAPHIERPEQRRRESTNSTGTFGSKHRRWSTVPSTTSAINSPFIDSSDPPSTSPLVHPDELLHQSSNEQQSSPDSDFTPRVEEDERAASTSSRKKLRRPLSMSSASDSTFSGAGQALAGLGISSPERIHIGRSNIAGASFPSPTLRRPRHKAPESEAEITAHLLKASGKNEQRIVPRLVTPPAPTLPLKQIPSPTKVAPSVGTPLHGQVKEEGSVAGTSDEGDRAGAASKAKKTSKLDKILGEGAEQARVVMEFERRAIEDVVNVASTTLPPPPRHKPSASVPSIAMLPILPPPLPSPTNRSTSRAHYDAEFVQPSSSYHKRSNSIDSLPSLHPSLSDSIHTLARLLPPQPPIPTHPPPRAPTSDAELAKLRAIPKPEVRNDLSAEQRAVLLRRTRKLEQLLGEPLQEVQVGRHVVDPTTSAVTVLTSVEHSWPDSPPISVRQRVPEYEREDCLPRTVRSDPTVKTDTIKEKDKAKVNAAQKAIARLGLGASKHEEQESDIRVYVQREMRVSETNVRQEPRASFERGAGGAHPRDKTTQPSPVSPDMPPSPERDLWETDEDIAKRGRRLQVAKLHRLLGVPVPASALGIAPPNTSLPPSPTSPIRPEKSRGNSTKSSSKPFNDRPSTPSDMSFMSFDETPSSWTKRMKSVLGTSTPFGKDKEYRESKKDSPKERDSPSSYSNSRDQEGSFMNYTDFPTRSGSVSVQFPPEMLASGSASGLEPAAGYTGHEKRMVRKRATKLEQVFGDAPPQQLYVRPASELSASQPWRAKTRDATYEAFAKSLGSLLHMAENDQAKLASLMDSIDQHPSSEQVIHSSLLPSRQSSLPDDATPTFRRGHAPTRSLDSSLPTTPTGVSPADSPAPSPPRAVSHNPSSSLDTADPNSFANRRHRKGKLSHFFGETSIDFTSPAAAIAPPPPEASAGRTAAGDRRSVWDAKAEWAAKGRRRLDTLDALRSEMWAAVQADVMRGSMGNAQSERLGDMMGALRRRSGRGGWEGL